MTKEEVKQYIRNQINSSFKKQEKYNKDVFYLYYNKSYLRALKLSKITGNPVNKEDFKSCEKLFGFDDKYNSFCYYNKIQKYLDENYYIFYLEQKKLIQEVLNEYEEYKGYKL